MEGKVVKNLAVDAKLFLHLVLPRAGTFRLRNFFIARKATVQIWVTVRSQEGAHEKSVPYPESYAFSKSNRTFHRRSGQPSARGKSRMGKYPCRGWCAVASANPTAPETRCRSDSGRGPFATAHSTASKASCCPNCGRSATPTANSAASKALRGGVIRPDGKRACGLASLENYHAVTCTSWNYGC